MSILIHPMPDSIADQYRQKLGKEGKAICLMLDRELYRHLHQLPPSTSDDGDIYRQGVRDGIRRSIDMIERAEFK